jgi:hypothetical protein
MQNTSIQESRSSTPVAGQEDEKGAVGVALIVWLLGGSLGLALLVFLLLRLF